MLLWNLLIVFLSFTSYYIFFTNNKCTSKEKTNKKMLYWELFHSLF